MLEKIAASSGETSAFPVKSTHSGANPTLKEFLDGKTDAASSNDEFYLLEQINRGLSIEIWNQYLVLFSLRRTQRLNADEHKALITITNRIESINANRLNLVFELARLQNRAVSEIMQTYAVETGSLIEKQMPPELREQILRRAGGECEYCRVPKIYSFTAFSFEMVLPQTKNGQISAQNIIYGCQGCANYKNLETKSLDFVTGEPATIYNPQTQSWTEHFRWTSDFTQLIGLTAAGRATIALIQINRAGLVGLRQILLRSGFFSRPTRR